MIVIFPESIRYVPAEKRGVKQEVQLSSESSSFTFTAYTESVPQEQWSVSRLSYRVFQRNSGQSPD